MRHRFKSMGAFLDAVASEPDKWRRFNISPGGAAGLLDVSRQRVHRLIKLGHLDCVEIVQEGVLLLLDAHQCRNRARNPPSAGRRPMVDSRQRL